MSVPRYARDRRTVEHYRRRVAAELARRFDVLAWFGLQTGQWWAMVDGRCFVQAVDPERLGEQIMSARRPRS
ncbi:hypothetical protein [Actinomadura spongiicola]|uniref:hypothetical protein n=1 Tax=Actinomadura spongiicola TaxID=2303421 RepID=UPI0011C0DF78|nr:hypothetical protein [Actinomadura spongiicola]